MALLSSLSKDKILFLIFASIIILGLIFGICFIFFWKITYPRFFKNRYYRKVKHIVLNNDYYLINQYYFNIDDNSYGCIDHLIFAEKYIYVIVDLYYEYDLIGNANDPSLMMVNHQGNKKYTSNCIRELKYLAERLSFYTNLPSELMIGIILVNDDCLVDVASDSKQFYIAQKKRLKTLIKNIESRDVKKIKADQLKKAVDSVSRLNKKDSING